MSPPSLRRNFTWAFAGSLVLALCQFAIIIAFAKVAGAGAAGDWTLALAITAPVFIFFQLKLRQVQATDARGENSWGEFLSVRILGMTAALVTIAGVIAVRYRDTTGLVIAGLALARAFEGGSDLVYGQLQRHEQMDRIARSQIGRGLSGMFAGGAALVATHSAVWVALSTAAAYGLWLAWDVRSLRSTYGGGEFGPSRDPARLGRLVRTAAPLGMVTAIGSLQVNVPRYFLEGNASRAELGVFGSLSQLLFFGSIVVAALASAALPGMARQAAAHEWGGLRRRIAQLMTLGFALGLGAILVASVLGTAILRLIYSEEYARHADVLVWLAVTSGLVWSYVFLGTALDAMRKFHIQPWIHGTSTAVIAIGAAFLVPAHGMRGAVWAMLIGYSVECVLYLVAVALPLRDAARPTP